MSKISLTTALACLNKKLRRGKRCVKHVTPISDLNDDILLHIFYIYRLHIEEEVEIFVIRYPCWDRQRWWYNLAHVSRRWRRVILAAPSLLDLHLVCTRGVPVADMLAHSPPLPLTIFYWLEKNPIVRAEDEKGALLALSHRDRVRRIALHLPSSDLEKLFVAMDGKFPNLERLYIASSIPEGPRVTLPRTFGAPNLSHVNLLRVALPIRLPLLTTTTGLVSLELNGIHAYFPPSHILRPLSLMHQLEAMSIGFSHSLRSPNHVRDTEIASHVTLPNLRKFDFWGARAYLECLCVRMTVPVLSIFHVHFFEPLTFTAPCLLSFMQTSVTFRFHAIKLTCSRNFVYLQGDPQLSGFKLDPFSIRIPCHSLDWQISLAIRILDAFFPVLSVVEKATLNLDSDRLSGPNNNVDRTKWRGLLRPLVNVKVLHVVTDVRGYGLGRSLRTEDGEQPLDLLPNLEELDYSGSYDRNAFKPFIKERKAVGRPVRVRTWWYFQPSL